MIAGLPSRGRRISSPNLSPGFKERGAFLMHRREPRRSNGTLARSGRIGASDSPAATDPTIDQNVLRGAVYSDVAEIEYRGLTSAGELRHLVTGVRTGGRKPGAISCRQSVTVSGGDHGG